VIIEGAIVDCVATTLVELSNVHSVTAVVLEGSNTSILLHYTACGRTTIVQNITFYRIYKTWD